MRDKLDNPHVMNIDKIIKESDADIDRGLSTHQAAERLALYGANVIESGEKVSAIKILLHNLNNIIVYLLMIASIVAFAMGDTVEGFAIIVAILIAVLSGFVSEYKAQKSIESLQKMVKTVSKVRRDNSIKEIASAELVYGDILYIEEGDSITADARIIESKNFATLESALTGESEAVDKRPDYIGEVHTPIGDRANMVYAGTAATRGNAYAIVVGTANNTEIGKISELLKDNKKSLTPLEMQLNKLGKTLIVFSVIVAAIVTAFGIMTGEDRILMIKIGIILAIAAVPEALPAVSTITLAIGMKTMASHNALVKNLPAVETLGSTTVICTDKTGTLTENQMTVAKIILSNNISYDVGGLGFQPIGAFYHNEKEFDPNNDEILKSMIIAGVLSSNATVVKENNDYRVIGDPTEGGLIAMGNKASIERTMLESGDYKRIGEIPFNSTAKFMATAYDIGGGVKKIYIKGAPGVLIDMVKGKAKEKTRWHNATDALAEKGMRTLAIGEISDYKGDGSEKSMQEHLKKGIELLGFTGIIDPPREDVKQAIYEAQEAGIRVIMITGDHPKTARIIAEKIGMAYTEKVVTGREMDKMTDNELAQIILHTSIFARVSPENKLQIVRALNIDKEVTAMTGDGVNDAPALNGADIGIAMGIRGTEVAKDASDMILIDDKFSTIVKAVKEGRVIFDNIEKFVYFLFSCNIVEILAVFLAIAFGMPMPILALQILWLNLVVDVLPAISLAWEPGEPDIMKRKPRDPQHAIVSKPFLIQMLSNGSLIGLGAFAVFAFGLAQGYSDEIARTMAFSTMAFGQLFHIFNVRGKNKFGIDRTLLDNPYLLGSLGVAVILQLVAVYLPFFNNVMGTAPLDIYKWGIIVLGSIIPTAIIQTKRLICKKNSC